MEKLNNELLQDLVQQVADLKKQVDELEKRVKTIESTPKPDRTVQAIHMNMRNSRGQY